MFEKLPVSIAIIDNLGFRNCTGCLYKEKCTRAKGNKRLYISKSFLEKRQESYENILSEKGVLKSDYEFQRFLLRGKTKVKLKILFEFLYI